MTVSPVRRRRPFPSTGAVSHRRLSRWAVGISAVTAAAAAASYAVFGVAYAVGGSDAIGDNWVGLLGAVALFGGLAASFLAFALAVVAKAKHDRWGLLWLPLGLFPTLLLIVGLVEALWME
jgi:hypothetical protein